MRSRAKSVRNAMAGFVNTGDERKRRFHKRVINENISNVLIQHLVLAALDELSDLLSKSKTLHPNLNQMFEEYSQLEERLSSVVEAEIQQCSQPKAPTKKIGKSSELEAVEGSAPDSKVKIAKSAKAKSGKSSRTSKKS